MDLIELHKILFVDFVDLSSQAVACNCELSRQVEQALIVVQHFALTNQSQINVEVLLGPNLSNEVITESFGSNCALIEQLQLILRLRHFLLEHAFINRQLPIQHNIDAINGVSLPAQDLVSLELLDPLVLLDLHEDSLTSLVELGHILQEPQLYLHLFLVDSVVYSVVGLAGEGDEVTVGLAYSRALRSLHLALASFGNEKLAEAILFLSRVEFEDMAL